MSSQKNLAIVINKILSSRRKRKQRKVYISCDIRKAYDSVNITKLFEILNSRAEHYVEKHVVSLMSELYSGRRVFIGKESFAPGKGVMQGSLLSPDVFAV